MSVESASMSPVTIADGGTSAAEAFDVINCSRLGRTANPPTRSFIDWLRPRRRRCGPVSGS